MAVDEHHKSVLYALCLLDQKKLLLLDRAFLPGTSCYFLYLFADRFPQLFDADDTVLIEVEYLLVVRVVYLEVIKKYFQLKYFPDFV